MRMNYLQLNIKACIANDNQQVTGFYIATYSEGQIHHRVITGHSQDLDLSDNNLKFSQSLVVSYKEINPNTIRRFTGLFDIQHKKLYEEDILVDDKGNLFKVSINNDSPVILSIELDSRLSQNPQEFISNYKLNYLKDLYTAE